MSNLVLVGFMGAGKTSVGRELAHILEWEYVDTDALVEERSGSTVEEIFARQGETEFRRLESEVIKDIAASEHLIIACGGGAILRPENAQTLKEHGHVVYLHVDADQAELRLSRDATARPLLDGDDRGNRIRELLAVREPTYRAVSDMVIDTSALSPVQAAERIVRDAGEKGWL